jgi:hypothetical protein
MMRQGCHIRLTCTADLPRWQASRARRLGTAAWFGCTSSIGATKQVICEICFELVFFISCLKNVKNKKIHARTHTHS